MGSYTGFYQGATVVRVCSAGHCVINAALQSGSVIQGELNLEVTNRMHKLAVLDRLSRITERPTSLVMPASPLDVAAMLAAEAPEEAEEIAKNAEQSIKTGLDTDQLFVSDFPDGADADFQGSNDLLGAGDMLMNMDDVRTTHSRQREEPTLGLFNSGGGNGGAASTSEVQMGQVNPNVPMAEVERYTSSVSGSREETPTLTATGTPDKSSTWSAMESMLQNGEEQGYGEVRTPMGTESQISVALSGERGGPGRSAGTTSSATVVEMDKTEIRKQRNRAAAAKSNLKRKLRNESIRRDLASLTQRAVRLRVKEMMLRNENTRLRNAIRKTGINR